MYFDPLRDPRYEPLQPTPEEIEAWASRERKRREAWLAGPTEDEQDEWVRRYRRRAALGFAESRLGPSRDDVAQWAEREHKRRQAWLAGPTEQEKREWARRSQRRGLDRFPESDLPPTEEEISLGGAGTRPSSGVARGSDRGREATLGPTRDRRRVGGTCRDVPVMESDFLDAANRLLREADLAAKGSLARAGARAAGHLVLPPAVGPEVRRRILPAASTAPRQILTGTS